MDTSALSGLASRRAQPRVTEGSGAWDTRALARPGTCHERGVTAPFTAPLLFGARLRSGPAGVLEVVVPNPSGREGWFVLAWPAAVEAFRPSLADRALVKLLGRTPPTPASLHAAALHVARQGLAGRAAKRAGESVALRGRASVPNRLAHLDGFLVELDRVRRDVAREHERRHTEAMFRQGSAVLAASMAQPADDPMTPERREWLLDGWEILAAGWRAAPEEERSALLRRAAALAPPVPLEAEGWPGGAGLAAAGSPRGGATGGAIAQDVAEAAFARWLSG